MKVTRLLSWAAAAVFVVACAKTDPAPTRPADASAADGGADTGGSGDPQAIIGAFDIRLVAADPGTATSPPSAAFVAILGQVSSAPRPPLLTLEVTAREGDCRVEVPSPPFCASCVEGTCVKGGICVPDPQPRRVGTVTLTGLTTASGAPVVMMPQPPQFFYQPESDAKVAFPPFAEGAPVRLTASGADLPAFEIASKGTIPLEVTGPTPVPMEKGKPLALRWKAATMAGLSRVGIAVDISHHGGFKGQIICDVADSGSFDVSTTLVDKLIDLGVAGYPTTTVTRRTTASAALPQGRVQLNVLAERVLPIVIPGYVSCSEDEPCPAGKTCSQAGLCQ